MKTQIIKIIPCLLAGFILSACVGAVNLADGTIAEANTKNTELETQTPKKLVIKEPEPQDKKVIEAVEVKPIISVETKPISANPCLINPFGDTCGGAEFNDAREAVCLTERESHRCRVIIPLVCDADSLDVLCAGDETYYNEQRSACLANKTDPRCTLTITRVCGADSLDTLCKEITEYFPVQKIACAGESMSVRCKTTISRICNANALDTLCKGQKKYYSVQYRICVREPNSDRCAPTIMRICNINLLDTICNGVETYYPAQKTACADKPNSDRCAPTVARVCDTNPLDALCNGLVAYYPAQENACATDGYSDSRCAPTIARICVETPFNTLCQSKNLTLHDIDYDYVTTEDDFPSSECLHNRCSVSIPSVIDIKPLNDTNTGMANYAGRISLTRNNRYCTSCRGFGGTSNNLVLIVNFNDNTLTYSGTLRFINSHSSRFNISLDINGNFTDRGQITGTVNYNFVQATLRGLIGQNKAIGVFSSNHGHQAFAGGFIATRE